jgi:hypothetical protein
MTGGCSGQVEFNRRKSSNNARCGRKSTYSPDGQRRRVEVETRKTNKRRRSRTLHITSDHSRTLVSHDISCFYKTSTYYVSLLSHSNTRIAAHVTFAPAGFPSLDSEQPGFGVFRKFRPRLCPPTAGVGAKVELIGGSAGRVIGDDASGYINIL